MPSQKGAFMLDLHVFGLLVGIILKGIGAITISYISFRLWFYVLHNGPRFDDNSFRDNILGALAAIGLCVWIVLTLLPTVIYLFFLILYEFMDLVPSLIINGGGVG